MPKRLKSLVLEFGRPLAVLLLCLIIFVVYLIIQASHHVPSLYDEVRSLPTANGCEKSTLSYRNNGPGYQHAWVQKYDCHILMGAAYSSLADELKSKGFKPLYNSVFTKPSIKSIPNDFVFNNSSFLLFYSFTSVGNDSIGLNTPSTPVYGMELVLYPGNNNPYN